MILVHCLTHYQTLETAVVTKVAAEHLCQEHLAEYPQNLCNEKRQNNKLYSMILFFFKEISTLELSNLIFLERKWNKDMYNNYIL